MESILLNASKYDGLAKKYEFDKTLWDKDKKHCLTSLVGAIENFTMGKGYSVEISGGKELCININPDIKKGRVRGRTAGIYVMPTKGMTSLVMNYDTYVKLSGKYELPDCKLKNNQYSCFLGFCELCSFIEAIISL